MLSVDGYTVKWGADTTDFERGSERVRKRVRADSQFFSDEWEKAQVKFRARVFGLSNVGMAVFGGVAASIGIATKALDKFAESHPSTRRELDELGSEMDKVWQDIGANVTGAIAPIKTAIGWMKDFVNWTTDVFQGEGISVSDALAQEKAQQKAIDERVAFEENARKALRSNASPSNFVDLWEEANRLSNIIERDEADWNKKFPDPASIKKSRRIADAKFKEAWEPFNKAVAEQDKIDKQVAEAIEKTNEASSKRLENFFDEADRLEKAREYLSVSMRTAQIEEMRARGAEREADAAKIRLDTERELREIWSQEGPGIDEKLAAAEAVNAAAEAQIAGWKSSKKAERPDMISTFLAPGMVGAGRDLLPQVLGGQNATYTKTITLAEQQLNALQDIVRNTSQNQLGVLGP